MNLTAVILEHLRQNGDISDTNRSLCPARHGLEVGSAVGRGLSKVARSLRDDHYP